jgi:hypothetical protein
VLTVIWFRSEGLWTRWSEPCTWSSRTIYMAISSRSTCLYPSICTTGWR